MDERTPIDLSGIIDEIAVPDIRSALSDFSASRQKEKEDLFAEHQRKGWDKSVEARCDFTRRVRITRRSGLFFLSVWQKSIMGRTLTEIKGDESMVPFFAEEVAALIKDIIGECLTKGDWCIVTTPKRRHTVRNFATLIAMDIAQRLHIPFYEDVCSCHTRQRVNAEFTVNVVPWEQNIICFDDFVTTGQTLASMKRAFEPHFKNMIFFCGINNKL